MSSVSTSSSISFTKSLKYAETTEHKHKHTKKNDKEQNIEIRQTTINYATITNDEIFILSYLNEVMQYMCFLFNACKGRLRLTDDENTQLSCKYMPKRNNEATKKCTSTQKYMSAGQTVEPRHEMY